MSGNDKSDEDAIEKISSNLDVSDECKVDRKTEPRYDNEIENIEETSNDIFKDFQSFAFFVLHRQQLPRRWFIRVVTWPYPF